MSLKAYRRLRVLAAAAMLAACAPQTEIVKLYDAGGTDNRPYERLLVVAITADSDSRRQLEDMISTQLQQAGVASVSAHTRTGAKTVLKQQEVNEAARESGADAILITHIVSTDVQAEKQEGRTNFRAECRGGGDPADYFLYDYDELKEPDTVRVAHTVVAVTNLYDAADRRRLWTIQSTCFDKETMDEVLLEEAAAIARQLHADRLID